MPTPAQTDSGPPAASPLAQALGFDESDCDLLESLFVESASGLGVEAGSLFARLREGEPVGQALAIPDSAVALLYARAHAMFRAGRPDKAEGLFRALCVLDGWSADHWVGYGVCLRMRSAWDEAAVAFASAARVRPDWAIPRFHALELSVRREDWTGAAAALAAFDQRADNAAPSAILAEVARFRSALALRGARTVEAEAMP